MKAKHLSNLMIPKILKDGKWIDAFSREQFLEVIKYLVAIGILDD